MHRFKNLLYVSHGTSDETDGLKQALSIARNNKAPLRVLVFCPEFPEGLPEYKKKFEEALLLQAQQSIDRTLSVLGAEEGELEISLGLESGSTPDIRVAQQVLENGYDLVIKEVEPGKTAGFRAFDMELLRKCPSPVWLCRPVNRSRNNMKVAVAVDPEIDNDPTRELCIHLLTLARSLADSCSGELHIISCWDHPFETYLRKSVLASLSESEVNHSVVMAERDHQSKLSNLVEESGITGDQKVLHVRGEASDLVPALVNENSIDVLVMGTVARTGVPGFIIGNTAENIFQELNCSVLALKPQGFVSPVRAR